MSILQPITIRYSSRRVGVSGEKSTEHRDVGIVFGQFAAVKVDNGDNWQITHVPSGSRISLMGNADSTNGFVTWFQVIVIAEALHARFPEKLDLESMDADFRRVLGQEMGNVIREADRAAIALVASTDYLK